MDVVARKDERATPTPTPTPENGARVAEGATVRLADLHRYFGATRALDGLDLTIEAGELVSLLGPSGCGKTTALRVLAGFETPDSGRVLVNGVDITHVPAQRRDMAMVFQSYQDRAAVHCTSGRWCSGARTAQPCESPPSKEMMLLSLSSGER